MASARVGKPHPRRKSAEESFWEKVDQSGDCWLWTGGTNDKGYGQFRGKYAHRVAYKLITGVALKREVQLDHRVACPSHCVNPAHLRTVTNKQNGENRRGANRNSNSGVLGVFWNARRGKWQAMVKHHRKAYYVGMFTDLKEAEAAVIAKRLELFTHNDRDRISS
jgi:hypothetical protein